MSQIYVCRKCHKEANPPKGGFNVCECPHCGYITDVERARTAGDARMLAQQQKAEAGLCEDQGCPQSHVPHVCVTKTDCRTEEGITVGLIDTIINSARLLKQRSWNSSAILEALKDLRTDEDLCALTGANQETIANLERENDQHKDARMSLSVQLGRAEGERDKLIEQLAKANKRADDFLAAINEWLDKTEWVQKSVQPKELGMHRADVMTARLQAQAVGPTTYTDFVDIESRNDVQEALQNFSHDSTRDNAVELIRAVYEATKPKC